MLQRLLDLIRFMPDPDPAAGEEAPAPDSETPAGDEAEGEGGEGEGGEAGEAGEGADPELDAAMDKLVAADPTLKDVLSKHYADPAPAPDPAKAPEPAPAPAAEESEMLETVGVQNFEAAYSVAESELAQVKDALTGTEKEIARISREYYAEQDRPEAERDREKIGRLQSQYEAIAPRAEQLAKTVKNHEMQLKTGAQIRANVTAIKPLRAALPDYVQAVATGRINPYAPLGEQITVLNTLRMAQGKPAVCVPGLTPKPAAIGKQPAPAPGNKSLAAQMKKKLGIVAGTSGGGGGAAGGKGGGGAPARPKVASKDPRALSAVGRNWKF